MQTCGGDGRGAGGRIDDETTDGADKMNGAVVADGVESVVPGGEDLTPADLAPKHALGLVAAAYAEDAPAFELLAALDTDRVVGAGASAVCAMGAARVAGGSGLGGHALRADAKFVAGQVAMGVAAPAGGGGERRLRGRRAKRRRGK